jgi:hypothetical protein
MNKEELIKQLTELHEDVAKRKEELRVSDNLMFCNDADFLFEKMCKGFTSLLIIEAKIKSMKKYLEL